MWPGYEQRASGQPPPIREDDSVTGTDSPTPYSPTQAPLPTTSQTPTLPSAVASPEAGSTPGQLHLPHGHLHDDLTGSQEQIVLLKKNLNEIFG